MMLPKISCPKVLLSSFHSRKTLKSSVLKSSVQSEKSYPKVPKEVTESLKELLDTYSTFDLKTKIPGTKAVSKKTWEKFLTEITEPGSAKITKEEIPCLIRALDKIQERGAKIADQLIKALKEFEAQYDSIKDQVTN